MTTSGLDTIGASQQTREHLRDAPVRLGACTLFVSWPAFALTAHAYDLPVHWSVISVASALTAIAVGYAAHRWSEKKLAKALAVDRAERQAAKAAQLAEFILEKDGKGTKCRN